MNWFRKFMYGRYGVDQLSIALAIFSLILVVLTGFLPRSLHAVSVIIYIPLFLYMYRTFSKNIFKRQRENYKYLGMKKSVVSWFKGKSKRMKDVKTHKYFTCPECKQKLRVPRGSGKISITCPKCKKVFKGKS